VLRDWEYCFLPDLSDWKTHDSYQKAFQLLVYDLKTENAGPVPATESFASNGDEPFLTNH